MGRTGRLTERDSRRDGDSRNCAFVAAGPGGVRDLEKDTGVYQPMVPQSSDEQQIALVTPSAGSVHHQLWRTEQAVSQSG